MLWLCWHHPHSQSSRVKYTSTSLHTALTVLDRNNQSCASSAAKSNICESKKCDEKSPWALSQQDEKNLNLQDSWKNWILQCLLREQVLKNELNVFLGRFFMFLTLCDNSLTLWSNRMTNSLPPEWTHIFLSLMSNFLHPSPWLSLLRQPSLALKRGPIFSEVIVRFMDFSLWWMMCFE